MRNLVFLLLIVSLTFGASIVKEFTFSDKNLTIKKVAGYDQLMMSESFKANPNAAYFVYPTEEGKPLIPFYSVSLLIPATAEIKDVTILETEKVTIPGLKNPGLKKSLRSARHAKSLSPLTWNAV